MSLWSKGTAPLKRGSSINLDLFRFVLALIILAKFCSLVPDFSKWLLQAGWMPHSIAFESPRTDPYFSVLRWLPWDAATIAVFALGLISGLSILVGFHAQLFSAVLFVALISLDQRNEYIGNGADRTLRVALFYLCFATAGSLWRGPKEIALWPQWVLRFQLSLIYLSTALYKVLHGAPWNEGYAIRQVLTWTQYEWMPIPSFFVHSYLPEILTWCTLVIEFIVPFTIWFPALWPISLTLGVGLHLGIIWTLNIPFFNPTMIAFYLVCIPSEVLESWRRRVWALVSTVSARPTIPEASAAVHRDILPRDVVIAN